MYRPTPEIGLYPRSLFGFLNTSLKLIANLLMNANALVKRNENQSVFYKAVTKT